MTQEKAEKGYTIYTGTFPEHSEVEFIILQHKYEILKEYVLGLCIIVFVIGVVFGVAITNLLE